MAPSGAAELNFMEFAQFLNEMNNKRGTVKYKELAFGVYGSNIDWFRGCYIIAGFLLAGYYIIDWLFCHRMVIILLVGVCLYGYH